MSDERAAARVARNAVCFCGEDLDWINGQNGPNPFHMDSGSVWCSASVPVPTTTEEDKTP